MIAFLLSQIRKLKAGLTSANNNISELETSRTRGMAFSSGSITHTITAYTYYTALCLAMVTGIGSSIFSVHRAGSSITITHVAGIEASTNAFTATVSGNDTILASTNESTLTFISGYEIDR